MTNKEYLLSLTGEEMYEKLRWLFYEYALSFTDSRQAIIGWLDAERILSADIARSNSQTIYMPIVSPNCRNI